MIRILCLSLFFPLTMMAEPAHWKLAPTPPMGWNSWDCFGTSITEAQCKAEAAAQAEKLKPVGYDLFVVDIQWYEPNARGHDYTKGAPLEMDGYSRLMPAPKRFPSAANGAGFKPLADDVHARGLKFGIHIMRGIPRQAVRDNTPIFGTVFHAADIADTASVCSWNTDMYGVDMSKPGAQDYYDSLFQLYASWGLDFVKVDDLSRPYDDIQKAEVEAIRKAIDQCGRPIIFSTSPGQTPLEHAQDVRQNANMWRIADDFWDNWKPLRAMFSLLDQWTPYRAPGAWPDADMLPFGTVKFTQKTHFTPDEQTLCLSLWSIARSPLIFGGDMTKLDDFTLHLLTNPEVIAIDQNSENNRQLFDHAGLIAWIADIPGKPGKYLGLFNTQDQPAEVAVDARDLGLAGTSTVRDLWKRQDVGPLGERYAVQLPAHGAGLYSVLSK